MNQQAIQAKSYRKKCKTCSEEIVMSNESGKWRALDTDNTTSHVCRQIPKVPPRPAMVDENTQNERLIRT